MKKVFLHKIISVLLIIWMITIYFYPVFASELDDKKQEKENLKNTINEAKSELNEKKNDESAAKTQLEKINEQLYQVQSELDTIKANLAEINVQITQKEEEIKAEEEEIEAKDKLLKERMVALYEAGDTSYLDVLINSEDLLDFISGYSIMQTIVEADTNLINELEAKKLQLENDKSELEKNKQKVEALKKEQEIENAKLISIQKNKESEISKLSAEEKELQKQIDDYNAKMKQVENEISEIARKEAEAAKKKNNNKSTGHVYTGGKLTWPCPGYSRISSYFGYRSSSSTGGVGSTNHKGIDMAASNGTNIVAAASGTVIKVSNTCSHNNSGKCGCGGGFGNYVMISHGSGLVTLYAHCSSINISNGATVSAGQSIAKVGSTGNSTGPHLHFSVLLNGTYVNPAPYLGMG